MNESRAPLPVRLSAKPQAARLAPAGRRTAHEEEEGAIDWRRLFAVARRFRWLILGGTIAGGAAGFALTRVLSSVYGAQATIWIDQPDPRTPDRGPLRAGEMLDPDAWLDLLKSYAVLEAVARDRQLYVAAAPQDSDVMASFGVSDRYRPGSYRLTVGAAGQDYVLATAAGAPLERGEIGDSIGAPLGFAWVPPAVALKPGRAVAFSVRTTRDAADRLADALQVTQDPGGNFLKVGLQGAEPRRAADLVNAIVNRFVAVVADLRRRRLTELTAILGTQVQTAQQNLRSAENSLEAFGVRTITSPTLPATTPSGIGGSVTGTGADETNPEYADYATQRADRETVQRDRQTLARLLATPPDSTWGDALAVISSVQQAPALADALKELATKQAGLRALRYKYTDSYPVVVRLAGEVATLERQTIPGLTRALVAQLTAREADLDSRLAADSTSLRRLPARAIEEARLRRNVAIAENLYTGLQQRYEEARIAEESAVPEVRVLDVALPALQPKKNTAPRVIALALLAGFGLAVCGAVVLDRIDPRVRYPEQVSQDLGLPILGAIPHLRAGDPAAEAEVVEALRVVRLNLVHALGAPGPTVVTFTSPGSGDGKSFLASNLAIACGAAGLRTLVVDADLRRGALHRRFGQERRPGLADHLRGDVAAEQILRAAAGPNVALVPCGTRSHLAPELLESPAMGQLLDRWRAMFDVVLVDSPPLAAGVDPFVLATLTGHLVFVLRTGVSHREAALARLEVLDRLPIRVLGAVLNDVPPLAAYRHYQYYLPGYEATDEVKRIGDRPRLV